MKTEYEIRILEIDKEEVITKLNSLKATKVDDYNYKRYVYDLNPAENGKWIRLRTDGKKSSLTYKDIISNTIDGTKEIEIEVDDFNKANELLEKIGFTARNYQENNRTRYILNNVEIDIDSWPMIPAYLEVEGSTEEEVLSTLKLLNIENKEVTTLNCDDIYKEKYNIDISKIKELKF